MEPEKKRRHKKNGKDTKATEMKINELKWLLRFICWIDYRKLSDVLQTSAWMKTALFPRSETGNVLILAATKPIIRPFHRFWTWNVGSFFNHYHGCFLRFLSLLLSSLSFHSFWPSIIFFGCYLSCFDFHISFTFGQQTKKTGLMCTGCIWTGHLLCN